MDPLMEEEAHGMKGGILAAVTAPIHAAFSFVESYGWFLVGFIAVALYVWSRLRPTVERWRQAREDAEHHKNPDLALARLEALQRARELQQLQLQEASQRAAELQRERQERKRQELVERLEKYGTAAGHRVGERDDDYMPLSAGASASSYRPPKRSKCGGGGCGR